MAFFQFNPNETFLNVDLDHVAALYRSVNQATVALPGFPSGNATAFVVGHRVNGRAFIVRIALHFAATGKHAIYTHEQPFLDADGARLMAIDALQFVESMGFLMENTNWNQMAFEARVQCIAEAHVFEKPQVKEAIRVLEPKERLARLLVQF